ncbi:MULTISPECIES: sulfurtransferase complex subunit TusB [unclassified Pseudomonas]|mgnify:FL=1|jgi:tRNA 2-thiouridine synthesizing protein B|uniref:sulfurtransferase complex subunit TusB n=1 Tax=unclassified Pseudomonas TaxID=196821 RepID=UPI00105480ED|nr:MULTISPECIES: sulfurtransferase complex subunit TusB [unclassified Pseudomonas]MBW3503203.1 sulfurtransferase complex subunit TusB [Pseudomonas sp. NKUCC02_KPG]MEC4167247.1 sulfurtransferase complex subunit TusB [Pseudomonas sp. MS-1(2024)]MEC4240262.1 sulfurtransferase complex subunit TusB [Pseudomonas sp. DSV-1]
MSTLHVVSHSPFSDTRLGSCLRLLGSEDAVLLCGDGVYALQLQGSALTSLEEKTVFILEEDLQVRNLKCPTWATGVDYPAFVELSIRYDKVNTWL